MLRKIVDEPTTIQGWHVIEFAPADYDREINTLPSHCGSSDHNLKLLGLSAGAYEYACPDCGAKTAFTVRNPYPYQ